MDYSIAFARDAREPPPRELNALYGDGSDPATPVLLRSPPNRFVKLTGNLIARGVMTRFGEALDVGRNAGFYSHPSSRRGIRRVPGIDVVPAMTEGGDRRVAARTGAHLVWDDRLLRASHGASVFPALNRAQFELGRRWPYTFATQFFYTVSRREGAA